MVTPGKSPSHFAFGARIQDSPSTKEVHQLDPALAVIFKGLQKRDATTRSRATEDLLAYLQSDPAELDQGDASAALVKAWIAIYPSLAIDVDRKIRSNAHSVLGSLVTRYKQKVARYLPDVAGMWMLGLHDSDRTVCRAARDALEASFTTPEKRADFKKIFRSSIRTKVEDLAFRQDPESLSDKRFINDEDAQAKFSNVTSAALQVLAGLVVEQVQVRDDVDLLKNARLWELVVSEDLIIQRAAFALLRASLDHDALSDKNVSVIKHMSAVVSRCDVLNVIELMQVLQVIAKLDPNSVFSSEEPGKKTLPAQIAKLIRRTANPSIPTKYWDNMCVLLLLATRCTNPSEEMLMPFLEAFHLSAQHAGKSNTETALVAVANVCAAYTVCGCNGSQNILQVLLTKDAFDSNKLRAMAGPLITLIESQFDSLLQLLSALAGRAQEILLSEAPQNHPPLEQLLMLNGDLAACSETRKSELTGAVRDVVTVAVPLIDTRPNAFSFVCSAFETLGHTLQKHNLELVPNLRTELLTLNLASCPEPQRIASLIHVMYEEGSAQSERKNLVDALLLGADSHSEHGVRLVAKLLEDSVYLENVGDWVRADMEVSNTETLDTKRWDLYAAYIESTGSKAGSVICDLLRRVADSTEEKVAQYVRLLTSLSNNAEDGLRQLSDEQLTMLSDDLWLLEPRASIHELSELLVAFMKSGNVVLKDSANRSILKQVLQADSRSIPIVRLCQILRESVEHDNFKFDALVDSLPSLLACVVPKTLPTELFILHPIGCLSFAFSSETALANVEVEHDAEGYSTYLRACTFLAYSAPILERNTCLHILMASELLSTNDLHTAANYLVQQPLNLGAVDTAQGPQLHTSRSEETLLSNLRSSDQQSRLKVVQQFMSLASNPTPSIQYYWALVFYRLLCHCREAGEGVAFADNVFLSTLENLPLNAACSSAFCEQLLQSTKASFQRNKWASELSSGIPLERCLNLLPRFLSLLPVEQVTTPLMQQQRLIFLVKHILKSTNDHLEQEAFSSMMLTILQRLLWQLTDEYGTFWDDVVVLVQKVLQAAIAKDIGLALLYTTLKLLSWLENNCESNDDFSEYWHKRHRETQRLIVETFIYSANIKNDNQGWTLCTIMTARLMRTVPVKVIEKISRTRLPALISNGVEHIQLSAFATEQKIVEDERDEMILECGLTKEYEEVPAAFPSELLSIVLDCPVEDENDIYDLPPLLPTVHRGYCMAWTLIFRYFEGSSFRMRVKLIDDLQELGLTDSLLVFIFLILRLQDDKPADISKVNCVALDTQFTDGAGEFTAYAAHLYFLALTHIPALVRQWWLDCQDRPLSAAVETLTEKYYSAVLIQNDVQSLQSDQSKALLKDEKISVKINNAGRDIYTTYEIDDQKMEMAIRLPANYPLRRVTVEGLQRVGVKDAQWRAWLLGSQAVLTAQNGSVVDAISLFQRNVSLHFQGVEDCNICFSILSIQDKSLPSKKCQTCKNLFHSSCLFKWFKSSSASRCPLCRTSFAF